MKTSYRSERLLLESLTQKDGDFIIALLNSEGFIRFIGDRNVRTAEDAEKYIQKILSDLNVQYRVVKMQDSKTPVGVITFIKRDYLPFSDIGFAFLPEHSNNGYALEAVRVVLDDLSKNSTFNSILAITVPDNVNSIKLLGKLGFRFDKEFEREKETLFQYSLKAG